MAITLFMGFGGYLLCMSTPSLKGQSCFATLAIEKSKGMAFV